MILVKCDRCGKLVSMKKSAVLKFCLHSGTVYHSVDLCDDCIGVIAKEVAAEDGETEEG